MRHRNSKSNRQDLRTDRAERDTVQKLKGIVQEQRKEINRLKKELERRSDVSAEFRESVLASEFQAARASEKSPDELCPECGSTVEVVPIGKFNLLRCTGARCDWRHRKLAQ